MSTISGLEQRLRDLLRERSITQGDFVLASGGRSTFYIDARRTTMAAEGLAVIGALALERLATLGWRPDVVGGLTLGADPVAFASPPPVGAPGAAGRLTPSPCAKRPRLTARGSASRDASLPVPRW